ncbi:two component transcriptional regulator, LuxR family [Dyella jiangningensis]|uniref:response regulator transcription factor n=2 Tax=Gammaproteobacteria TaxID=1236 RepID=UPI000887B659|nr:response regulator transcription factor [Dyella sp. AtDHG13]PXV57389.1 LuxR family two component transcriptional regulator [Dyella sp. AtDHG13]SDK42883.1 two component transcriptional regulator, LuxR family [Dyella jiangningensis]
MRVIIADDHPVVLIGLKTSLRDYGNQLEVVGEARNGRELLERLAQVPCDLLITDFSMPADIEGHDGLALLQHVRETYPSLPILVLTMLRNPALVQNMVSVGVRGVVDKMAMAKELILAIDMIRAGRSYLSERMRRQIEGMYPTGAEPVISKREVEVVRFLAQGMTVSEIARRLERSVKTISQQKRDAMRKLNLDSDKQLYDYARSIGLL